MSLPARQRRALAGIETQLTADDRLRSLFVFFTRLAVNEAMPGTENVIAGANRLRGLMRVLRLRLLRFVPARRRRRLRTPAPQLRQSR